MHLMGVYLHQAHSPFTPPSLVKRQGVGEYIGLLWPPIPRTQRGFDTRNYLRRCHHQPKQYRATMDAVAAQTQAALAQLPKCIVSQEAHVSDALADSTSWYLASPIVGGNHRQRLRVGYPMYMHK